MSITAILIRSLFIFVFYFTPDIFISSAIKKVFRNKKKALKVYWLFNIILITAALSILFLLRRFETNFARFNLYMFGIFISFLFTKILVAAILFGEDIIRIPLSIIKKVFKQGEKNADVVNTHTAGKFLIGRRKFISQTALIAGIFPFSGFIYGMLKGRYDFRTHEQTLYFDDLPVPFDGITITQISDLHIGSFDKFAKHILENLALKIQELNSDILFFTGDVVNSRATEMDGWYDVFNHFTAPLGKFSILGNHDYGDYVTWPDEEAKKQNLENVKNISARLGFKLLLNEHVAIEKNNEKIFIVGVENWGKGDFPKFGDIKKASEGLTKDDFRILLSHDPSHWDAKVLQEEFPPQLTLSGHTHGFQMGIEIPAFRFSPSQWIYKQWAGLYQTEKYYLYVNRGLGTIGYPGRLGIWPEITRFVLKRK